MNIYIWHEIEHVSDSYHSDGSVVVFAETLEAACELANSQPGCNVTGIDPTEVRECSGGEPKVYIMPNAGCC